MAKHKYLHNNNVPEDERTHAVPEAKQLGENVVNMFDIEKSKGKNLQDVENGDILEKEVAAINQYNDEIPHGQHPELWGNTEHNTIMTQFLHADGAAADEIVSSQTPEGVDRDEYNDSFAPLEITRTDNQIAFQEGNLLTSGPTTESPISTVSSESFSVNEQDSAEDETMYPIGVVSIGATVGATVGPPTVVSATTGGDTFSSIHDPVSNNMPVSKETPSYSHKRKREDDETDSEQGPSTRRVTEDMVEETISSIYDLAGDD